MSQTDSSARLTFDPHCSASLSITSGYKPAFDLLDALVQRRLGVAVEDRDRFLGEDRAAVDVLGDEMHGRAGDLDAELERVAHRVPALERGEQRRVRVDGAAAVRVDERLREDRAEAGDRDEVDVVAFAATSTTSCV